MIRAVIFDLDGVIVETSHFHFLAWKRLAEQLGTTLTEEQNQALKGVSRMRSLEIILDRAGQRKSGDEMKKLADQKNQWYLDHVAGMETDSMYPGVEELLRSLRQLGMKLGLASSSKNATAVLDRIGLSKAFDVVADGNMIQRTKPDPEIFLTTASRLHERPTSCVVFEDAEAGVEAAVLAGMKCVGIGQLDQLSKADLVLPNLADFEISFLQRL